MSHVPGGGVACLVAYLDFAPRNRELALALARRFMRSVEESTTREWAHTELQERFMQWLVVKSGSERSGARARQRFHRQTHQELMLIGLLDQYRAGSGKADAACPLYRAAHSEHV